MMETIYCKGKKYKLTYEDWPHFRYKLECVTTGETAYFENYKCAYKAIESGEMPKPEKKQIKNENWIIVSVVK